MQPAAGMLQAVLGIGPLRFAAPRTAGLRTAAVPPAGLGTVRTAAALGIEPELELAGQRIAQECTAAEQTEGLAVEPAQTAEPEVLLEEQLVVLLDVQAEQRIAVLLALAAGLLAVQLVQLEPEVQQESAERLEVQLELDQVRLEVPERLELAAPSSEPS